MYFSTKKELYAYLASPSVNPHTMSYNDECELAAKIPPNWLQDKGFERKLMQIGLIHGGVRYSSDTYKDTVFVDRLLRHLLKQHNASAIECLRKDADTMRWIYENDRPLIFDIISNTKDPFSIAFLYQYLSEYIGHDDEILMHCLDNNAPLSYLHKRYDDKDRHIFEEKFRYRYYRALFRKYADEDDIYTPSLEALDDIETARYFMKRYMEDDPDMHTHSLDFIPTAWIKDSQIAEIVCANVYGKEHVWGYDLPRPWRGDKKAMLAYINSGCVKNFAKMAKPLRHDKDIVLAAAAHGLPSEMVPEEMRDDKDIALLLAQYSDIANISDRLKNDKTIACLCITHDIANTKYLSDSLKKDQSMFRLLLDTIENIDQMPGSNKRYPYPPSWVKEMTAAALPHAGKASTLQAIRCGCVGDMHQIRPRWQNDKTVLKMAEKYNVAIAI